MRSGAGRGFWLGWGCGFSSFALDPQLSARRIGKLLPADAGQGVRSPALNSACVALGWVWFWGFGLALRLFFICPAQLPARRIGKLLSADAVGRVRSPGVGFGVQVSGWE